MKTQPVQLKPIVQIYRNLKLIIRAKKQHKQEVVEFAIKGLKRGIDQEIVLILRVLHIK